MPQVDLQLDELLPAWRAQPALLGNYVVHVRTDGQPAAVLTVEQWAGLPTQERFGMQLAAELARRFCAAHQHAAPAALVACGGCQRCASPAEALSAELSDCLALGLRKQFGELLGMREGGRPACTRKTASWRLCGEPAGVAGSLTAPRPPPVCLATVLTMPASLRPSTCPFQARVPQ